LELLFFACAVIEAFAKFGVGCIINTAAVISMDLHIVIFTIFALMLLWLGDVAHWHLKAGLVLVAKLKALITIWLILFNCCCSTL